ncbi:indole-3-glycerol phosphate synthase TrpC [Virgibacillus sp. W0181]|uniref:indole-3-glycerol phosphate synthase TrpC n=1 Tax=Virgibacillus sp. W0181 TaxID=3391581 RepID=UPI003F482B44
MTILDKILQEKTKEVELLKGKTFTQTSHKQVPTFREKIKQSTRMGIIAEIKRSSPSKGNIHMTVDPVHQAKQYEACGASAISVLTDKPFFNGTMEDLKNVRQAVDVPILCKDFMIDKVQIDQAKAAGANIILLIVAALDQATLTELYHYAVDAGLEVLVEVHQESEMERALQLGASIIGINNRDLKTFTVDLETTDALASMVTDPNTLLISESGIRTKSDVSHVAEAGAQAILVGETFMRAENVQEAFNELQIPLITKEG